MTVPLYNLSDTWNSGVTTFTAIKMSVTNTSSASDSKLFDLLVGGTSKFNVGAAGEASATGLNVNATNPETVGTAAYWQTALISTTWDDVTGLNPSFSNLESLAIYNRNWHVDATYTGLTQAKTTQLPLTIQADYNSGAQRFLLSRIGNFYGMGDAFINTRRMEYGGGPLPGDEGFGYSSIGACSQPLTLTLCDVNAVTRAAGNTTITQDVIADKSPQTVTVASTAGMVVGDWYQVQRGVPDPVYNTEAIKVTAIGVGTITALFRVTVASGATLTPALVLAISNHTLVGQLRVLVNLSGASYSTGTITAKSGKTLSGSGMSWTDNMVGGDASNIGAISLDKDTYSGSPFNGSGIHGALRAWYEISEVQPTQLNVVSFSIAGDLSYRSSRWDPPSNYIIRPAVRVLRNLGNGTVICETTTATWTPGDSAEQAICPYPDYIGDNWSSAIYSPGATSRSLGSFTNIGPVPVDIGLNITSTAIDQPYGMATGINLSGGDYGIRIIDSFTAAINIFNNIGTGTGKIRWDDQAFTPYIERDSTTGSLNFVYGGSTGEFGGMFCDLISSNLATAEFRSSRLGVTGNGGVSAPPYIRMSATPAEFSSASTSIDIKQGTVPTAGGGYRGLDLKVYGTSAFSATEWGMGTGAVLQCVPGTLTLSNGANARQNITKSFLRITGPTGAFSLQGFQVTGVSAGTGAELDGAILYLYNSTAETMTLRENVSAHESDIKTLTGGDVAIAGPCVAMLIYNSTDQRWILMSTYT